MMDEFAMIAGFDSLAQRISRLFMQSTTMLLGPNLQLGDIGAASLMFYHPSIHETRHLDEDWPRLMDYLRRFRIYDG